MSPQNHFFKLSCIDHLGCLCEGTKALLFVTHELLDRLTKTGRFNTVCAISKSEIISNRNELEI